MTLQNLIIRHKQYYINNDLWKYQPLTFKVQGDGNIELTLYTKTATDNHYLQYSFDGNTWEYAIQEIAPISTADNFKARYKIATIAAGQSIKLRGNVLSSSIHGTFSTKKYGDVFYDVYGNPASLYSSNAFVNIENVDLTELFANYIDEEINKSLYYDDDTLSWKSSGTTKIYEKESSTIKYGRVTSIYQDNVLRSIKNLWLQHSNGIYTKMFIGSQVKTLTDYMPISGNCKGMFYSSQIISNDLSLQLPSTVNNHNYEGMFAYCPNIRNITINIENNDIYAGMFLGSHLEKINITYNNINNGGLFRTIKSMFFECSNINQFNITLNNISVPVFDEYFRFTIPNTLTDCSNSVLNINNISTTNPVWKIFKNSNIESTPVINNPNNKNLNNIFNQESIQYINQFQYRINIPTFKFKDNLQNLKQVNITRLTGNVNYIGNSILKSICNRPITIICNKTIPISYFGRNHNNNPIFTLSNLVFLVEPNQITNYEEVDSFDMKNYAFNTGVFYQSGLHITYLINSYNRNYTYGDKLLTSSTDINNYVNAVPKHISVIKTSRGDFMGPSYICRVNPDLNTDYTLDVTIDNNTDTNRQEDYILTINSGSINTGKSPAYNGKYNIEYFNQEDIENKYIVSLATWSFCKRMQIYKDGTRIAEFKFIKDKDTNKYYLKNTITEQIHILQPIIYQAQ